MRPSVCLITETFGFGGVEIHTLSLIKELIRKGSGIELVQCRHNEIFERNLNTVCPNGIRTFETMLSVNDEGVGLIRKWQELLACMESDVLILPKIAVEVGSIEFLKTCRKVFRRIILIEHSLPVSMPSKFSRLGFRDIAKGVVLWWYREKYRRRRVSLYADKIVAVSKAAGEALKRDCWYPSDKISVIVNGVDLLRFRRNEQSAYEFKTKFNIDKADFVFGMVTRIEEVKGVDIAVEAFAGLLRRCHDRSVVLVICGGGGEGERVKQLISELGICKHVVLTGFIHEPDRAFSAMDSILLPSRSEALGITLLEGMAAGCIPIVSKVGGMPEVVNDRSIGWVVKPNDIEGFRSAMEQVLYLDSGRMEAMRKGVVKRVKDEFDSETSLEELIRFVEGEG